MQATLLTMGSLLWTLTIFTVVVFGLAWPLTARLSLNPVEKLVATSALSLIGVFLCGWIASVFAVPFTIGWVLPCVALIGAIWQRNSLLQLCRDRDVQSVLAAQSIVSLWCLGWAMLIASYSGGGWSGDWFEHWERASFFLERWPDNFLFLGHYPLTARPPLANVVTAIFLRFTSADFAHYQIISTLLSSLAFLPAALLARYFGGNRRAFAELGVLFMVSPLFVQNATFAWTKLPAAFFVLTALYFFLRANEPSSPRSAFGLFAVTLAAGLLTHYSSGPYAVVLVAAWVVLRLRSNGGAVALRASDGFATAGALLLLMIWFGWALAVFGVRGTFFTNSAVTGARPDFSSQLWTMALNLRDTIVPHFLRSLDRSLITQVDPWGAWRDWFFQLYQLNLFFAFGSVAWLGIAAAASKSRARSPARSRKFWLSFIGSVIVLGIVVHSPRDTWGLAHICLQPLVLLGLAFLAASWSSLSRGWRSALLGGAAVDLALGILLHFSVQHHARSFWFGQWAGDDVLRRFSASSAMNFAAQTQHQLRFLNDVFTPAPVLMLALLGGLLILAITRARAGAPPVASNSFNAP